MTSGFHPYALNILMDSINRFPTEKKAVPDFQVDQIPHAHGVFREKRIRYLV
jgi:hypothetical protein